MQTQSQLSLSQLAKPGFFGLVGFYKLYSSEVKAESFCSPWAGGYIVWRADVKHDATIFAVITKRLETVGDTTNLWPFT